MDMYLPKFNIYHKLKQTQTLDVLIFFKIKFSLMTDLKFTLSDVTSFLSDNLPGLKKIIFMLLLSYYTSYHWSLSIPPENIRKTQVF